jgi:hypothetical protein
MSCKAGVAVDAADVDGAAAQQRGADSVQDTEAVYEEVDLEDLEYDEVEEVHPVEPCRVPCCVQFCVRCAAKRTRTAS